jgi:hypothetical protein
MAKKAKKAKKAKAATKAKASKTAKKAKQRPAAKRDLVRGKNATMFAKRTARGRFKEIDEAGRSLKADRTKKAKKKTKSGYGDSGDR